MPPVSGDDRRPAVASPTVTLPGRGRLAGVTARQALPIAALMTALGVYFLLNLTRLGAESFWTDELFSVSQANLDPLAMLKLQAADNHPPLYAMVLWVWIRITHDSTEASVRLVSLAAITAGIGILSFATWRRVGLAAAIVVATLAATSSLVASFTFEARMHGLAFGLICATTAAWLFLLRARPLPRWLLVVFVVTGGLAAFTQYYAFMVYVLEAGLLGAWILVRELAAAGSVRNRRPGARGGIRGILDRLRDRELILLTATTGLSLVPVLAWLVVTRRLLNPSGTPPLTLAWADDVAATTASPFSDAIFGEVPDQRHGVALILVIALVAVALLLGGGFAHRRAAPGSPVRQRLALGSAALGIAIAAAAIGTIESIVFMPTMHYRSVMGILPVAYLGLGLAATAPFGRHGLSAGLAGAAVLAAIAVTTPTPPLYTKDDWRGAATLIRAEREAGLPADRIVLVAPFNEREWLVELNNVYGRRPPVSDIPPQLAGITWIAGPADLAPVAPGRPLLLVAFHYWEFDVHDAIVATTRDRFGPCQDQSVTGITILRCDGGAAGPR